MPLHHILVIGGSGFVGSAVVGALAARGLQVTVPTRRRDRARHLLPLPPVHVVEADVFEPAALAALMRGQDAVVNLVGVLQSRPGQPYGPDFARAHVELPRRLVAAAQAAGVGRLVHVSALKASPQGPSAYLRSMADGEAAFRAAEGLAWTILQPSVIFGPGDSFLRLFAGLLRLAPVFPLAGADARFQPVYVGDVATLVADSLTLPAAHGQTWEVCGPTVYTLRELVQYVGRITGRPRWILPLPGPLATLQALVLEHLPGQLMSRDNLASMRVDNVAHGAPLPLGRTPTALETIAPDYLR